MANKKWNTLTKREMDVLTVLWGSERPLVASDIAKMNSGLSINTVQAVLRDLLKKEYVVVADIVYSGTVLCRSYRPTALAREQTTRSFAAQYKELKRSIPPSMLFAALLESEQDEDQAIAALEAMIKTKKDAMQGE